MEICNNKDIEGKISKIPRKEENSNDFFFKYKLNCKKYIIGINLYNNTYIIISIALSSINDILFQKLFTFEEIEKFDQEFFVPFKKNIFILFKFITRLLLADLIDFETIEAENKNLYYLNLNCLKDSYLRPIKIYLNDDEVKEINIDSAPVVKKNSKVIKIKMNNNNKANQNYRIELRKIEHKYENSEIYKEIEIKFTNEKDHQVYYDYINSKDIFDREIPYYNLFNNSIEDVYDDLNIIIYHKNYYFEKNKYSIKFWFYVFNIGKSSIDPYFPIFIEALNRERLDFELHSKMEEYFQYKLNKNKKNEKSDNIDEHSEEKAKKENKILKKKTKINSQKLFLENFLSLNKDLNSNTEEKNKNNTIKKENNEQKDIIESDNKYNNIGKNKFVTVKIIINKQNIKNNTNKIFNLLEKENETNKDDSSLMNRKRHTNLKIDMFFSKTEKYEENNFKKNENYNINENINKNNIMNNNKNKSNNNNIIKEPNNNSLEIEEKKEDIKLNIDNFQNKIFNKSENINMNYKLDENGYYNINKDEVVNNYFNIIYVHPLDNDNEYKIIENDKGEHFYLCMICHKFFNNRNSVREHQWEKHLKPFGKKIQKDLKSKFENKSNKN